MIFTNVESSPMGHHANCYKVLTAIAILSLIKLRGLRCSLRYSSANKARSRVCDVQILARKCIANRENHREHSSSMNLLGDLNELTIQTAPAISQNPIPAHARNCIRTRRVLALLIRLPTAYNISLLCSVLYTRTSPTRREFSPRNPDPAVSSNQTTT